MESSSLLRWSRIIIRWAVGTHQLGITILRLPCTNKLCTAPHDEPV
ncbi:MAG: hypothetical protein K9M81_04100 [Chthoniobacterales bacterium]|nr:hypothetical protein [Chthoniobacterales bacterium]